MPDITQELTYYGSKGNKPCNDMLDKLFAVDPENPLGICARDGIDTRSCRSAYAKIEFAAYSSAAEDERLVKDPRLRLELRRLREKNELIMAQYEEAISKASQGGRRRSEQEKNNELRPLYAAYLSVACTGPRLRLAEVPLKSARDESTRPAKGKSFLDDDDELPFQTRGDASSSAGANALPKFLKHTRVLPERCNSIGERALSLFPGFPPAICQRWGYYSPTCIDAKRAERRRKMKEAAAAGSPLPAATRVQEFKTF